MAKDELTDLEKITLLAAVDSKQINDIDHDFLLAMRHTRPLKPDEVDNKIRRTMYALVDNVRTTEWFMGLTGTEDDKVDLFLSVFTHGVQVGQKYQKSILKDTEAKP